MISEVKICNNAYILLGEAGIESFEDGSVQAEIAKALYESLYEAVLSENGWHFATKHIKMSNLVTSDNPNYNYQYLLPADTLYVIDGFGEYEIFNGYLYSNRQDQEIDYVFKPEVNTLPPYFSIALQYRLAAAFAIPITSDLSKAQLMEGFADKYMAKARFNDASSRTMKVMTESPYTKGR